MSNKTIKTRIVQKHATSADWTKAVNFKPLLGEIIVYDDLKKIKIGDGNTLLANLSFIDADTLRGMIPENTLSNSNNKIPTSKAVSDVINDRVPNTRKVNGKALSSDITLSASDVGAATENYVDTKVAGIVNSAPEALNTLDELAAALGDDPNFATTVLTQIGGKVDKVSGKGLSTNDFTTAEKEKLASVEAGANAYVHPTHTAKSSGFYKVTIDNQGHVSAATAVTKSDITALGIPAQDTTYTLSSFGITATATELNYVDGVTSNIQTQLNSKASVSSVYTKTETESLITWGEF